MNTPDNLRHLFADAPEPRIDLAAVTRRSRARRLPKVLGIGVAGVLAIGGLVAVSVQGLSTVTLKTASDSSAGGSAESAETFDLDASRADPSMGLVLDLVLDPADGPAVMSLTNTGTGTLSGQVTGIALRLLQDDGVIAEQVTDMVPVDFELAPGASVTVQGSLPMVPVSASPGGLQVAASLTVAVGPDALPVALESSRVLLP